MFTMRSTARSCPTIFPKSRRSKSRTSGLLISGSSCTSSETNGLTIALHLLPVFSQPARTAKNQLPLSILQLVCQSLFSAPYPLTAVTGIWWNRCSPTSLSAVAIEGIRAGGELLQWSGGRDLHTAERFYLRKTLEWRDLVQIFPVFHASMDFSG